MKTILILSLRYSFYFYFFLKKLGNILAISCNKLEQFFTRHPVQTRINPTARNLTGPRGVTHSRRAFGRILAAMARYHCTKHQQMTKRKKGTPRDVYGDPRSLVPASLQLYPIQSAHSSSFCRSRPTRSAILPLFCASQIGSFFRSTTRHARNR